GDRPRRPASTWPCPGGRSRARAGRPGARPGRRRSAPHARGKSAGARRGSSAGCRAAMPRPGQDSGRCFAAASSQPVAVPGTMTRRPTNVPMLPEKRARPRRRKSLLTELLPRLEVEGNLTRQEQLVREMLETCLKLLRDGARLGDVKLLNAALRELRYAFKVFAPYRDVRKISIFGSARTKQEAPQSRTAYEFARRITDAGFMVITGAGGGIMHAAQEGAGKERSFGVNIRLPFEQEPNEIISNDPKLLTF